MPLKLLEKLSKKPDRVALFDVHRESPITAIALRRGSLESFMNPVRG
jgi:hypothetical protein